MLLCKIFTEKGIFITICLNILTHGIIKHSLSIYHEIASMEVLIRFYSMFSRRESLLCPQFIATAKIFHVYTRLVDSDIPTDYQRLTDVVHIVFHKVGIGFQTGIYIQKIVETGFTGKKITDGSAPTILLAPDKPAMCHCSYLVIITIR